MGRSLLDLRFLQVICALRKSRLYERRLSDIYGKCYKQKITIDSELHTVMKLRTLLHEGLHLAYPNWSEKRVVATEKEIWRRITARQVEKLARIYRRIKGAA